MNKNILIIGGCGYIGSRLRESLYQSRYTVSTVDLEWFGSGVFNDPIDYSTLSQEYLSVFDVIINLAAHSSVPMANGSSHSDVIDNNLTNFVSLVGKISPHTKFIYASSASVYNGLEGKAQEWWELHEPANIYDFTKQAADDYIMMQNSLAFEWYGLRFGTVNGPSSNLRTDIMINQLVDIAQINRKLTMFNPDINRSILCINDLVRGIHAIIESTEDATGIYNMGSFNTTVRDIVVRTADMLNVPVEEVTQDAFSQAQGVTLQQPYNFQMNTKRFEHIYNFQFEGTIESIVNDLVTAPVIQKTHRKLGKIYDRQ